MEQKRNLDTYCKSFLHNTLEQAKASINHEIDFIMSLFFCLCCYHIFALEKKKIDFFFCKDARFTA